MKPGAKSIDASLIARVARMTGAPQLPAVATEYAALRDAWMSPLSPLPGIAPQVAGRQWDYPVGLNIAYTPRANEPVSFAQMRALADSYDLLRLIIETRKDQIVKMKWTVAPIDDKKQPDARSKTVMEFLKFPDQINNWQAWLRALLEDLCVTDAPAIYPRMTKGGGLYALELVDGTTIKPVIDETGRRPMPPLPAFQQILKGVPAANLTRDELIYFPRNVRTHKLYGYSPVEQIIMSVNIAMRRQLHQLQYYTEGSTPDLIMAVPDTWQPDQVQKFSDYWNGLLGGNTAERRQTRFVPNGVKPFDVKEHAIKDEYDEWLARIVCFAFSISPQPFIKQMNRATAVTAQEASLQEGLVPIMQWIKDLLDEIIWRFFGFRDLEFEWLEEEDIDPQARANIQVNKVKSGLLTINEARMDDGMDPVDGGDEPLIYTASGAVLLADVIDPPEPPPQLVAAPGDQNQPQPNDPTAQKLLKKKRSKPLTETAA